MPAPYVWFIHRSEIEYGYLLCNDQTQTLILSEKGVLILLKPYQQGCLWGIHPIYQMRTS